MTMKTIQLTTPLVDDIKVARLMVLPLFAACTSVVKAKRLIGTGPRRSTTGLCGQEMGAACAGSPASRSTTGLSGREMDAPGASFLWADVVAAAEAVEAAATFTASGTFL
jgi:hypothetical protein